MLKVLIWVLGNLEGNSGDEGDEPRVGGELSGKGKLVKKMGI